jgi:Na+-transporting methylmalonyl-CoA/oxaloacetate decarboxylase gamma subunit
MAISRFEFSTMFENFYIALQITLVGMTLVFASLAVFGIVMVVLVRVTADGSARPEHAPPVRPSESELKARAAAAAVALALAQKRAVTPARFEAPPTAVVSPWQAVMRANQLRQRGRTR